MAALLAAKHAIEHEGRKAVAIVAGDTVASAPLQDFLARADSSCRAANSSSSSTASVPSPVIPNLYDRVARWHMEQYGTTREQLVREPQLKTVPMFCRFPASDTSQPYIRTPTLPRHAHTCQRGCATSAMFSKNSHNANATTVSTYTFLCL